MRPGMILFSHPMGNAFVRELGPALAEAGLLDEFWTGLDYPEDESLLGWLPASLRREARRRRVPTTVRPFTHLKPWGELARLLGPRLGLGAWSRHEFGRFSPDRIFHAFDRRLSRRLAERPGLRGVYLYEDGAEWTFAAARARGLRTFYDLPIGYWRAGRRILGEEAELSPEWAATLAGNRDSAPKLARKDRELALADTVFVASSFTRSTLAEAPNPPADVVVAPYGAPPPLPGAAPARRAPGEALRILFVGSLGQRKGLRYLLDALPPLGASVSLTLLGMVPEGRCEPLAAALRRHRHIPTLPHAEVLAEMRRHHVLVFPSLFEGFGLVLLEAMACGLPVIATPHTAAPDLIAEGIEGFVVPIRSAAAITEKLALLAADEDRRHAMGVAALARASALSWADYRATMVRELTRRLPTGPL